MAATTTTYTDNPVEAAKRAEQAADALTAILAVTPTSAGDLAVIVEKLRSAVQGYHLTVELAIVKLDDMPRDIAREARDALETASIALMDAVAKLSALGDEITNAA